MCSYSLAAMFACDIGGNVNYGAEVMSHELGHSLGFKHDDKECACDAPNRAHCVMWPSGNPSIPHTKWSQCSRQYLADSFQKGVGACLKNIPDITPDRTTSVCGNGIVEADEQCDCGNLDKKLCNSACCDPKTCKLVDSATCASGKCCDTATCQMKQKWTECRDNSGECDLPEFCDGISPYCPADTYKPDGMECTNGVDSYCYKGQCNSHRAQCPLLWGERAEESDSVCYKFANIKADYGDCGIDYKNNSAVKLCQPSDMMCGRLFCAQPNAEAPPPSQLGLRRSFEFSLGDISCKMLVYDYGMGAMDPGLVPNGAKCDGGKMCVNQRCVDVNSVLQSSCSPECKPNEVCNNLNKCQSTSPDLDL